MRSVELTSCREDSYREVVNDKLSDISDSIYGPRVSVQLPIEMLQPPLRTCEIIIYVVSRYHAIMDVGEVTVQRPSDCSRNKTVVHDLSEVGVVTQMVNLRLSPT